MRVKGLVTQAAVPIHHAGFLRTGRGGPLMVLGAPAGLLRIHETDRYRSGSVVLSRVDELGGVLWERDLGIQRLEQILVDAGRPTFSGTRPAAPGRVPEPILVIVDATTGIATMHSLIITN